MIQTDQPTLLSGDLLVAFSSKSDGTMLDRAMGVHDGSVVSNRTRFCDKIGINYGDTVYQRIIYSEKRKYNLICEVDDGSTTKNTSEVVADALFTSSPGVALMLPVADCVATVVYDPNEKYLALIHLGRHSTMTNLLKRVIDKFILAGSKVDDLKVWMSPSAKANSYILDYFERSEDSSWQNFCYRSDKGWHIDMAGYNANICYELGIPIGNVEISSVDTITSDNYFSHYAGDQSGRMVAVAVMSL